MKCIRPVSTSTSLFHRLTLFTAITLLALTPTIGATDDDDNDHLPPPSIAADSYQVFAANDLGMHCADQDYQIMSILPPFNVMHAQVIRKGNRSSKPQIVDNSTVDVVYFSAINPNDPVGPGSINTTSQNRDQNGVLRAFKSNFWDTNPASGRSYGFDTYAPLYFGLLSPAAIIPDTGLPVPDSVLLPIGDCLLSPDCLSQQAMPGITAPYSVNHAQHFDRFDKDFNFFQQFPFGQLVANTNWFAADGVPILPVDDQGRANAYPLMQVEARTKTDGLTLASVDVVLPVASEADCQACHADQSLCNHAPELALTCNGYATSLASVDFAYLSDATTAPGETPEQRVLNAAKINILRLHDAKHNTQLDLSRPVQCSTCHYSPALDLAQLGPVDDPAVGVEQTRHHSMSRVMHSFHGKLEFMGEPVFPSMPPPIDAQGQLRDPFLAQQKLEQNCYQCHPGKRTQCLRGAMFSGGSVCQDCHGEMEQVGNDFTRDFPTSPGVMAADLRVPWASEPGCQSCHTGDALNNLTAQAGVLVAPDGIRLLQAFSANDVHATPIQAVNKQFAEDQNLYRISKGHGGVMCEACHGSTHAIWPNAQVNANDNVASVQLQGHSGTISECATCHGDNSFGIDDFKNNLDANGRMKGPHGMHPVGDAMWNEKHKEVYHDNKPVCQSCHGVDLNGSVLSRAATDRTLECKEGNFGNCVGKTLTVKRGDEIGCVICHKRPE